MNLAFFAALPWLISVAPASELGALDIRVHPGERVLHPPAQLLVEDPFGFKCGLDPATGESFEQIAEATYESESIDDDETGAEGPETRILYLGRAAAGKYRLVVAGIESGTYTLEIRTLRYTEPEQAYRFRGSIRRGEVHEFSITLSGEELRVARSTGTTVL